MKVTYCSFADDAKCRGVLVLKGEYGPAQAAVRAHALRQNPGGQLLAIAFDTTDQDVPPLVARNLELHVDRLMHVEEAIALFDASRLGDRALTTVGCTEDQESTSDNRNN